MTLSTSASSSTLPSLEELQVRKEQLGKEIELLSDSFDKLKEAQELFIQNISTLTSLKTASSRHEVLIPLTNSVFATAQLMDTNKVLVDIGTGYFVEKEVKDADDYYVRKIKYLQEQLNMIGNILGQKQEAFQMLGQAIRFQLSGKSASGQ